jgi:hypothetical protein
LDADGSGVILFSVIQRAIQSRNFPGVNLACQPVGEAIGKTEANPEFIIAPRLDAGGKPSPWRYMRPEPFAPLQAGKSADPAQCCKGRMKLANGRNARHERELEVAKI